MYGGVGADGCVCRCVGGGGDGGGCGCEGGGDGCEGGGGTSGQQLSNIQELEPKQDYPLR